LSRKTIEYAAPVSPTFSTWRVFVPSARRPGVTSTSIVRGVWPFQLASPSGVPFTDTRTW
jgi:hypothetical protein